MIQLHKESQVARRVRLTMALPDKNGFFAYEYQNENKKWSICNAKTMLRIANGLATEQSLVSIDDRASEIDLDELTERNLTTNVTRKIRCIKSGSFVSFIPLSIYSRFSSGQTTVERVRRIEQTAAAARQR